MRERVTDLFLEEGDPPVVLALEESVVIGLVESGAVRAAPVGPGRWEISPTTKVGVLRCGPLTLWIAPKVPIGRLMWMLGWASRDMFTAPGPIGIEEAKDVVPVVAEAFCALAERALRGGLLQGYVSIDSAESVLRGRLRLDEQVGRRFGLPVPLFVRFDDYISDTAENQLVKAAAARLLRVPGLRSEIRSRLRRLRASLAGITDLIPGMPLPAWAPSRLNARYASALWLAEVILREGSVEQEPGILRIDGFLLDVAKIFEEFVTSTLKVGLESHIGHCTKQDNFFLDAESLISIRPDLVWRSEGRVLGVVDAKYKAEKPSGFPQADLYQALAYAIAYDIEMVHLVYAAGNEVSSSWRVRNSGVVIVAHTLRLDDSPEGLLRQVAMLADAIAANSLKGPVGLLVGS